MKKPTEQQQIFDVIWNNASLRDDLFGNITLIDLESQKPIKMLLFKNWINNLDNKLFVFIKSM